MLYIKPLFAVFLSWDMSLCVILEFSVPLGMRQLQCIFNNKEVDTLVIWFHREVRKGGNYLPKCMPITSCLIHILNQSQPWAKLWSQPNPSAMFPLLPFQSLFSSWRQVPSRSVQVPDRIQSSVLRKKKKKALPKGTLRPPLRISGWSPTGDTNKEQSLQHREQGDTACIWSLKHMKLFLISKVEISQQLKSHPQTGQTISLVESLAIHRKV